MPSTPRSSRNPSAKPGRAGGSRSAGHRGHSAEPARPKKSRWTPEERLARGLSAERRSRPEPSGANRRPDWTPGGPRAARPADQGQRPDRDFSSSRPGRADSGYRSDSGHRSDARYRSEERADRGERRRSDAFSRDDRPARQDRRREDASFRRDDRPERTDRRRPDVDFPRRERREDGFRGRDERKPFGRGERPFRDSASDGERYSPREDVVLERLEAITATAADSADLTFADLGLGQNICAQLAAQGAERPFPIQAATIPDVIAGRDVLGRGRTGSGKTIAFGAPLVERLLTLSTPKSRRPGRAPRALILAPTRELAMQIDRTVQPIARSVGLFTVTIVGGVPQYKQTAGLQRGVDIVIATPGRLEDLVDQGRLDLSEVVITVLDEADHMCDLGFLEPVQRILRQVKPGSQRLLFSATLDKGVAGLVDEFLTDPQVHEVQADDDMAQIDHRVLVIEQRDKTAILRELVSGEGKSLVFARTRAFAEQVAEELTDAGVPATSLHGDLNQARRSRNLQQLTSGRVRVLVATDVAARGIHVDDVALVVQADAPDEYKTYLHRSGRTGRAGKNGTVVTLVTKARRRRMSELLGRADVSAEEHLVRPGDAVIAELAGLAH